MRLKIFLLLSAAFASQVSVGQKNVRESVYLHVNNPLLLTGETLYYSAFVRSSATGEASQLSQILYVELLGPSDKVVFQQKIKLDHGKGQGQFFVSSLISTGNYRLIAYTRWMKNFGDLFQTPITLVNPFETYKPLAEEEAAKLSISFFPEGGNIVIGAPNTVVYQVINGYNQGLEVLGRVVDSEGTKVAEIKPDQDGLGQFAFTPKNGVYQAIIEDQSGAFLFFKLPEAQQTLPSIRLTTNRSDYKIEVLQAKDLTVQLVVTDGQNQYLEINDKGTFSSTLLKEKLKSGSYQIKVIREGKMVASRIFVHEAKSTLSPSTVLTVANREQVVFPIKFDEAAVVSVSVRQKDKHESVGSEDYQLVGNYGYKLGKQKGDGINNLMFTLNPATFPRDLAVDSVTWMPDLRGEWISGKVSGSTDKSFAPIFAICGEKYHFWSGEVKGDGTFSILADPVIGNQTAYLRVPQQGDFEFTMDSPFLTSYPDWEYAPLKLDSAQAVALVKRSIHNQIENAYYKQKKDSSLVVNYWRPELDQFDYFYRLDDYKRFPELYEYFIEYIPTVSARNNKRKSKINVFTEYLMATSLDPLILLDGLPVTAEEVLNINPYLIESIGVINNRVFIGSLIVDGVVALHTYKHKLEGFTPVDNNLLKLDYQGLEPLYEYTFPSYDSSAMDSRIPDYRTQLYWNPNLTLTAGTSKEVAFYTSDVEGEFEIQVEGYTATGKPISIRKSLLVKAQAPD